MNHPDVSVCITTYNHAAYIARCIESVVAQWPAGRLEILVGDDGSSDGTRDLLAACALRYPGVVIPVFHERNLGPSGNYRALIARAGGRYIAHLDGDDHWMPGKLASQVALLERSPACPAVLTNAWVVDRHDLPLGFFTSPGVHESIDLDYLLESGNFLCHGTLLYRQELKDRILSIPGEFIDYMILVRLAAAGNLAYLDEATVVYRWNSTGSMRAVMTALVGDNYWQAMLEAQRLGAGRGALRRCTSRFLERLLTRCLLNGQFRIAIGWIQRVRRESPVPMGTAVAVGILRIPLGGVRFVRRGIGRALFRRISVFYPR